MPWQLTKLPELIFAESDMNEWYIWGYLEYLEYMQICKLCLRRIIATAITWDPRFLFWDKVLGEKRQSRRLPASSPANPSGFYSSKTTLMVPSSSLKTFLSSCQDDLSTYWQENICGPIDRPANHLHCILVQTAWCNQHRFARFDERFVI